MGIQEACRRASELNREQEAKGTCTRYVVVAQPVGACGGEHQVVARSVGRLGRRGRVSR
jgi:hypothetical protein